MNTTRQTLQPLLEYQHYDGETFITFNMIELNEEKNTVTCMVTNRGRLSMIEYDLCCNSEGLFFEYGPTLEKIYIEDFEQYEGGLAI